MTEFQSHTAVALTVENERLRSELRRRLEELDVCRRRAIDVAEVTRRRIERNLHDGMQQRLVSVAMLAAMGGREPQLDVHLRGALNVGLTLDELREVLIHVAPYAGFPAAINAMRRLQAVEADT